MPRLTPRARAALAIAGTAGVVISSVGGSPASARVAPAASGPGHWLRVTPVGTGIIDDIGLARGTDGVLHVLWASDGPPGNQRIADTPITAKGAVKVAVTITHFFIATDPDATLTPSGVAAIWNGDQNSSGTPSGTFEATRPRSGGSWTLGTNVPQLPGTPYLGSSDAAATGSDGQPWVAFTGLDSLVVDHFGHPEVQLGPAQCCVYQPGLGTDGHTGTTWVTYMSLISHHQGVFARPLTASGASAGSARLLPGSENGGNVPLVDQRVGTTGRGKGHAGVYVVYLHGYPSPHSFDLARLGPGTAVTKIGAFGKSSSEVAGATVTTDPKGRLWITWFNGNGSKPALFVRRSNLAATTFGKTKRVPLPSGTTSVWKLYMNAQAGRLDVLALVSRNGKDSKAAYWSTQVLPPK